MSAQQIHLAEALIKASEVTFNYSYFVKLHQQHPSLHDNFVSNQFCTQTEQPLAAVWSAGALVCSTICLRGIYGQIFSGV